MKAILTAAAALALGLTTTAGLAQTSGSGSDAGQGEATTFDIDERTGDDNKAAFEDFDASFEGSGAYDRWDADGDGMVTREEFSRGVYERHDLDGDGFLNDEEITGMGNDRLFMAE